MRSPRERSRDPRQGAIVIAGVNPNPVTGVADHRAQAASTAAAAAVPTDLPAPQAVSPAASIPASRNDSRKSDKGAQAASRVVIVDQQTNTLVFRSLDASTGAVIAQEPSRALLRQRAYVNAQAVQAVIKGKDVTAAELAAAQDVDSTA
jgi:hypothetical protein